ncbi:MAG TPA: hypothetical protein VGX23_05490 [Actinocrinis sp.]|nr:hypothetical protein [Actinocrinis sp.]
MVFENVQATAAERAAARPGDESVRPADVVMDRAFTVPGDSAQVWPWIAQLGKARAGWYLPRRVERALPRSRRTTWAVQPAWQHLDVGDIIPDCGGRRETFEVAAIDPPHSIVYRSRRRQTEVTWSITIEPLPTGPGPARSRVFLRLRMAPIRHKRLAETVGDWFDLLTVAGMAAGLAQRLDQEQR